MKKCFDKVNLPELSKAYNAKVKEGMTEQEQRDIATEIALDYHKQLHDELAKLRKATTGKAGEKYVSPSKAKEIESVKKEYAEKKEEVKKEPAKVEEKPKTKVEEKKTEKKSPIRNERPLSKQEEKQLRQEMADSAKMQWAEFNKKHPDVSRLDYMNLREDALKDADGMDKMLEEGTVIKTQDGLLQTVSQYIDKAQAVLDTLFPGMKVVVFQNASEYVNATGSKANSGGVWKGGNEVFINMEAIRDDPKGANTPIHEAIHPIVEHFYALDDTQKLDKIWDQVQELQDAAGLSAIKEHINRYRAAQVKMPDGKIRDTKNLITTTNRSTTDIQAVEGITELLTMVADGRIDPSKIPQTTWGKFSKIINDIFKALGISFRVKEPNDLRKLAEGIQQAFQEGDMNMLKQMIAAHSPKIKSDLKSFDNLLEENANEKEIAKKLKEIIEKYPDVDPDLIKKYIKEKTGWKDTKVNTIAGEAGVNLEYTNRVLDSFGMPIYEASKETEAEWIEKADKMMADGYDVNKLIESIDTPEPPAVEGAEKVILGRYLGALEADNEANPTQEKQKELNRIFGIVQRQGTVEGRALRARRFMAKPINTLASFVNTWTQANKAEPTDKQYQDLVKLYEEEKAATQAWKEKAEALEAEATKREAELTIQEEAKKAKKSSKPKQDFAAKKKSIADDIRKKWKDAGNQAYAVPLPYLPQFVAIAPDVAKYVKVLIDEKIDTLEGIIKELRPIIDDVAPGATDRDIIDLIAGKYNEPKQERKPVAEALHTLKKEADLIGQLEDLRNGIELKTEKAKVERNRRLAELEAQIGQEPLKKLSEYKSRTKTQIAKLEEQLAKGDFAKPEKKLPIQLDKEGMELRDKANMLKKQKEMTILKAEHDARTTGDKAWDVAKQIVNVPRTLMATADLSMIGIQGSIGLGYGTASKDALNTMRKSVSSDEAFEREARMMKDSPRWDLAQAINLALVDPDSPYVSAQDEAFFARNLIDRMGDVKIFGKKPLKLISGINKMSERAYVSFLNRMRWGIFNQMTEAFEAQGKTWENEPELYKSMGTYINNITGRGTMGKKFETLSPILSAAFFSPRMIASRLAMLKSAMVLGRDLPPELRKYLAQDTAKFIGTRLAILGVIYAVKKALGKDGEDEEDDKFLGLEANPLSSDFGRIRINDTRFDIWGGFQSYVRVAAQASTLLRKSTKTKELQDLSEMGAYSDTRGTLIGKFFRGKLSPTAAFLVDVSSGEDALGRPVELGPRSLQLITPMIGASVYDLVNDLGWGAVPGAAVNFVGITSNTYDDTKKFFGKPITLYDDVTKKTYPASQSQMDEMVQVKEKRVTDLYLQIYDNNGMVDVDEYGDIILTTEDGDLSFGSDRAAGEVEVAKLDLKQKQKLRQRISQIATNYAKKEVFQGAETKKED
jgi:hypothetical protein